MEIDDILRLIDAVAERGLAELSIEKEGMAVRITRPSVQFVEAAAPQAPVQTESRVDGVRHEEPVDQSIKLITSPMVGTYYAAPSPSADPYVRVGDAVKKGQTLCIIEAMKLMNEIECDVTGTVVEVCVDNVRPVEFGDALFKIKAS